MESPNNVRLTVYLPRACNLSFASLITGAKVRCNIGPEETVLGMIESTLKLAIIDVTFTGQSAILHINLVRCCFYKMSNMLMGV